LGVDDWAKRKGQSYGTILVDLEQRKPIELLQDREAETLSNWLKQHPGVQTITRDRAGAYADGARQGAPQAQQVADRWHLLKNISETFERLIHHYHKQIREAVKQLSPVYQDPPIMEKQLEVVAQTASEYMRSKSDRQRRQQYHAARKEKYEKIRQLQAEGLTVAQISKYLRCNYYTVDKFYRSDEYQPLNRNKGRSCADKFDTYLRGRWNDGCHNAQQLYSEVKELGYRGSAITIRRHVQLWRQQTSKKISVPRETIKVPTPRSCVWLLLKNPEKLTEQERQLQEVVIKTNPAIEQGCELVQLFREVVRSGQEEKLEQWIERAEKSKIKEIENFVKVLQRDKEAVRGALRSKWSNGQVEGQINRLKYLKRQMFGRAKFDLLRARVLHTG
jgi:transposase